MVNDIIRSELFLFTIRISCVIINSEAGFFGSGFAVAWFVAAGFVAAGFVAAGFVAVGFVAACFVAVSFATADSSAEAFGRQTFCF